MARRNAGMQKFTDKVLRSDSIRVKPKDTRESLSSERLKNTVELPKGGYGLHTAGNTPFEKSTSKNS